MACVVTDHCHCEKFDDVAMTVGVVLPDLRALTERYAEEAVRFIRGNSDSPFFLYFAHMYVHLPLYAPENLVNASENGDYGACVVGVDWVTEVLMDELKRQGLDDNTLVIFTSDNGSRLDDQGGSNGVLRARRAPRGRAVSVCHAS